MYKNMNDYFFYGSIVFMYMSYGCAWNYIRKKLGPSEVMPELGKLLYNLIVLSAFILPVISLCHIYTLKWYWLFLINLTIIYPSSFLMSFVYSSILDCKASLQYNYNQKRMMSPICMVLIC